MKLFAPAKVNFGLSVLGRRKDGYHDLSTLMVPLSVGDELEIERAGHLSLVVRGAELPTDEGNLVFRAARAYLDAAGVWDGARITLHKQVPLSAGLGGGSSDAAGTLLALARLYPANVNLPDLARALGADVPFFLLGSAAFAGGTGEKLARARVPPTTLVLANPGIEVSAGDAYRWLDQAGGFTAPLSEAAILAALSAGGEVPYFNALEAPALARFPRIGEVLSALSEVGLRSPLMSGSGSTCFALAASAQQAEEAARSLASRHPDWWVRAARTT